jgi:NAD(P)-dependent dehydrogenase (short-subunit alcohol dehydrogenase family)
LVACYLSGVRIFVPPAQILRERALGALYRQTAAKLPVAHIGEVEEIAEAYLYLMRQTYGTGEVLRVDGGGALV